MQTPDMKPKNTSSASPEIFKMVAKVFVESTLYVFKIQSNLDISVGSISKVVDTNPAPDASLFAKILVKSESGMEAQLLLGFSKDTFLGLASHVLGTEFSEITDENKDLVTEFLNMIYGVMKSKLKDEGGFAVKMAIPEVAGVEVLSPLPNTTSILIPFKLQYGEFVGLLSL